MNYKKLKEKIADHESLMRQTRATLKEKVKEADKIMKSLMKIIVEINI